MGTPDTKRYKRSWKNLLLNKRYQLRFTLFMVGLSAVLMTGLGIWVMKEANEATTVAMARVRGEACTKIPTLTDQPELPPQPAVPMKLDEPDDSGNAAGSAAAGDSDTDTGKAAAGEAGDTAKAADSKPADSKPADSKADQGSAADATGSAGEAAGSGDDAAEQTDGSAEDDLGDDGEPRRHVRIELEQSSLTLTPSVPKDYADRVVEHWTCELRQASSLDSLARGRMRILWVLVGTGVLLMFGLAIYGIKMTHKVAGPLFKVSLYLAKMRDGKFDTVYNLRKGDQLVEFYDHFKAAHAGVVQLERDDIEKIKAVIAAAELAGVGDHDAIVELRGVLQRKEKSLE